MKTNNILSKISKIILIVTFLIPFSLMAQGPPPPDGTDNGSGSGSGTGSGAGTDPDAPIDGGAIAIVFAGLSIGTIMLMKKKNTAKYSFVRNSN